MLSKRSVIVELFVLTCDGDGCGAVFEFQHKDEMTVLRQADALGWEWSTQFGGGKIQYWCPTCSGIRISELTRLKWEHRQPTGI